MKKIPSVFIRDMQTKLLTTEVNPECQWVLDGEGIATKKFDGMACMIKDGFIYKRYDAKRGKTPPEGFIPCQEPDAVTGNCPGWVECDVHDNKHQSYDTRIAEAYFEIDVFNDDWEDGTYELCGPKVNTNREGLSEHKLIKHGSAIALENKLIKKGMVQDCLRTSSKVLSVNTAGKNIFDYTNDFTCRTFETIKNSLFDLGAQNEGIVYHHPDGRMAKVKYKDFF